MSEKKSSKKNKKPRKHYTILPYFRYAIIYVLVSMIVVVPLSIGVLAKSVSTVHQAQTVMTSGLNELEIDDTMPSSNDYLNEITQGKLLGKIVCEDAGINEKIYYGINRVTQRNGVGLDSSSYIFGSGGCSMVAGYYSSSFKAIKNLKIGDTIVVETSWGKFNYKVVKVQQSESIETPEEDSILLATYSSGSAFSCQTGVKNYALATLTSKEVL